MKKLSLVCLFVIAGFFGFSQYSPVYVSGSVKDVNGSPISFQSVLIVADSSSGWSYFNKITTDSLGLFSLTITPPASKIQNFYAYTYDCNSNTIDTFFTNATQQVSLNFTICIYTPPACQADFYYYPDTSMNTINFFDKSTGTPNSYYWSFGDSTFSYQQNPTHTFVKGNYNVCLTISDSINNCSDTYCTTVYIDDSTQYSKCSSYFTHFDSSLTVYFLGYNKSNNSNVVNYNWDFGDGTTSSLQNPVHSYTTAAQYFVTLTTAAIDNQNDSCYSKYYDYVYLGQQQQYGSISGFIKSKTYSLDNIVVYLIKYNLKDSTLSVIDSTIEVDSGGYAMYYFGNVPYGDYLVKAALTPASTYYSNCLPTYYGNVLFWDLATTVRIDSCCLYVARNIDMITGINPGGPGFIGGKTTKGANIWIMNEGIPIGNVEVLLLDQSGNPVSYNFTKTTGDFGFNSLPFGTYKVYPEMPGWKSTPAFVTIDVQHPSVNDVQIVITEKKLKASINSNTSDAIRNVGNIYPNPVQSKFNFDINIKKPVEIDVQITNNLGQIINTTHYKLTTGKNTISSDSRNLPQGTYILNIKSADGANIFRNFTLIK